MIPGDRHKGRTEPRPHAPHAHHHFQEPRANRPHRRRRQSAPVPPHAAQPFPQQLRPGRQPEPQLIAPQVVRREPVGRQVQHLFLEHGFPLAAPAIDFLLEVRGAAPLPVFAANAARGQVGHHAARVVPRRHHFGLGHHPALATPTLARLIFQIGKHPGAGRAGQTAPRAGGGQERIVPVGEGLGERAGQSQAAIKLAQEQRAVAGTIAAGAIGDGLADAPVLKEQRLVVTVCPRPDGAGCFHRLNRIKPSDAPAALPFNSFVENLG